MNTEATAPPSQRLHALDNLRAAMMWLGIVLHAGAIYTVKDSPLPWHDTQTSPLADLLVVLIHAFRMPVFFILAGFFVALLVQKRGAAAMLKNRLMRLGLPFALLWPPIFAASVVLILLFVHRMARGVWGLDATLMPRPPNAPKGPNTLHLWFLWMLLWFSVLTVLALRLARALPLVVLAWVSAFFQRLARAWWGFALLSLPLALVGAQYGNGLVAPGGAFLPPLAEWLHYGLFFVFGWYIYQEQEPLFALYARRRWRYALAGLPFFLATGVLIGQLGNPPARTAGSLPVAIAFVYSCAGWLWSLALIGLFQRYLAKQNALLRYLSESSYWVYLLHFPLTIGFGALLYSLPLPALVKMGLNIAATTPLCLASYHLFVRFTPLGVLLNGKRHSRQPQGAQAPAAFH